ncbi:MAG: glycerate kinase [Lachnospiraceae bacterium]|nr:glycerate kinase [Lachnospiraceae bacterium]
MGKIVIAPDSFKGSMSASEVAKTIKEAIMPFTDEEIVMIPVADGGEGSIECILNAVSGEKTEVYVTGPEWKGLKCCYAEIEYAKERTAVVEFAESTGITKQTSYQTGNATSYGFGQLIRDALDKGIRRFYLCLGGSATTDGGCGFAAALGYKFLRNNGRALEEFVPTGFTLEEIAKIDKSNADSRIKESSFVVLSDVLNPFYGELGAAYVYAPQKGANEEEVLRLDNGLRHLSEKINEDLGIDVTCIEGTGAAGGAGGGCIAFLGAKIESGIDGILKISNFEEHVKDATLVITGEGCLDRQSLMGKVLSGIKKATLGKKIMVFCGICKLENEELESLGIEALPISSGKAIEDSIKNGRQYLYETAVERFKRNCC